MLNLAPISNPNDITTKEYVDSAVAVKENIMQSVLSWPDGAMQANKMYMLGSPTNDTATVTFANGTSSDDMLYLSISPTSTANIAISGSNYSGLASQYSITVGDTLEIIGIWHPSPMSKWVFAQRIVRSVSS